MMVYFQPLRNPTGDEDSLEAEELFFDLEDTDSRHNMISDHDDYDSDGQFLYINIYGVNNIILWYSF